MSRDQLATQVFGIWQEVEELRMTAMKLMGNTKSTSSSTKTRVARRIAVVSSR